MDSKQFGKKIGKHAQDFGLDPKSETGRAEIYRKINDIVDNYDELRSGTFRGQEGEVDFYIKGRDVVIIKNGNFISILKDGADNGAVRNAKKGRIQC